MKLGIMMLILMSVFIGGCVSLQGIKNAASDEKVMYLKTELEALKSSHDNGELTTSELAEKAAPLITELNTSGVDYSKYEKWLYLLVMFLAGKYRHKLFGYYDESEKEKKDRYKRGLI